MEDKEKIDRISFSYPKELKDKLQKYAKADNRKLSPFIQIILQEWVDNKEKNEVQPTVKKSTISIKKMRK